MGDGRVSKCALHDVQTISESLRFVIILQGAITPPHCLGSGVYQRKGMHGPRQLAIAADSVALNRPIDFGSRGLKTLYKSKGSHICGADR